jgi:hypothetical protein
MPYPEAEVKRPRRLGILLANQPALERMPNEALSVASKNTVRGMAANFADGVAASLS